MPMKTDVRGDERYQVVQGRKCRTTKVNTIKKKIIKNIKNITTAYKKN